MTWEVVESLEPDTEVILPESNQGVEYGLMGFVCHASYEIDVFTNMFATYLQRLERKGQKA